MNDIDLLHNFFEKIFNKMPLEGTNKPSHIKANGKFENLLIGYYHYHCGPYIINNSNYINDLNIENLNGSKSGPAIHYLKYQESGQTKYLIVAYVKSHGYEIVNPKDGNFTDKNKIYR